jgi:pyrroline-5-carboxylate reductase
MKEIEIGKGRKLKDGDGIVILSFGHPGNFAASAIRELKNDGINPAHYDMRFAKPIDEELLHEVFAKFNKVVTIEEKLMDAATVLGACGIAYALRFIRANIQGGIEIGFDSATAALIAAQTVKGAAELLIQTGRHPEQEIDKVTTPKGCTITGLNEMEHRGFSSSLIKGIAASFDKISPR